jgi:type I restriction enzyme S subunit
MENIGQYITNYVKGKAPKDLFEIKEDGMLPYLSPDYLRGKAEPEFYAFPNHRTVQVDEGDVIVLWDGSNAGEIFTAKNGVLASTMVKLEFDESELNQKYYAFSFQYLEYFLKAKTAGSGIPHADKGVIKKLDFFKPPKPEQTAIASILSKVDEAIEATQNSIKAAEKLKKALMQNLLSPMEPGERKKSFTWMKNLGKCRLDGKLNLLGSLLLEKPKLLTL